MATVIVSRRETLYPLMGGSLALAAAMGVGRFAYTPILPVMQSSVGFSTNAAGFLASANYAGYLAGALLVAGAPAATPRRRILLGCLVAIGVTTALMAVTTDLIVWGIVRFVSGIASAGVFVLASGLVLGALRARGSTSLAGWLYAGVGIGITISGVTVRLATGTLGWRGDWLALSAVAALAVYPCWRWLPRQVTGTGLPTVEVPPLAQSPSHAFALLFVAYFLEAVGYIVTGTFLVAIVVRTPGLESTGSSVWIAVGLAGIPAAVAWTALAARFGLARTLAAAYFTQACGILLPTLGGVGAAYGSAILFGGTFLGITSLTLTLAGHLAPHRTANVIGLLTAAYGVGQIIGPILAASLASQTHSFTPALIAASAVILVGGALATALHVLDLSERPTTISLRRH